MRLESMLLQMLESEVGRCLQDLICETLVSEDGLVCDGGHGAVG